MAVLKRFSYDNIVEHNPTAPDPVDYDGGEGGGGAFIVHDSHGLGLGQLDKTWSEIYAATGTAICVLSSIDDLDAIYCAYLMNIQPAEEAGDPYTLVFGVPGESTTYRYLAMNADSYPISSI